MAVVMPLVLDLRASYVHTRLQAVFAAAREEAELRGLVVPVWTVQGCQLQNVVGGSQLRCLQQDKDVSATACLSAAVRTSVQLHNSRVHKALIATDGVIAHPTEPVFLNGDLDVYCIGRSLPPSEVAPTFRTLSPWFVP
jgi:hypothetical protein